MMMRSLRPGLRYSGKRRRQIEDLMEERALAREISDIFDERI